jgi:hypothetical protein
MVMFVRLTRSLVAVAVAIAVLGACGGGDDAGDDATAPPDDASTDDSGEGSLPTEGDASDLGDGCTIVTADDGEAILGEPVQESEQGTVPAQLLTSCIWEVSEDSPKLLQFYVFDGAMFYAPDVYEEQEGFEEIEGLGDAAFISGVLGLDLTILDGERTITLTASGFSEDDPDFDIDVLRQSMLDVAEGVVEAV